MLQSNPSANRIAPKRIAKTHIAQRCLGLASLLAMILVGSSSTASAQRTAQEPPPRPRAETSATASLAQLPHATPLGGTIILWGGGEPSEEILQSFERIAQPPAPRGRGRAGRGGRRGRGNAQRGGNGQTDQSQSDDQDAQAEQAQPAPPKTAQWTPGEPLPENIGELDGLWVRATKEDYASKVAGKEAEAKLKAIVDRGGAVAIPAMKSELFPFVSVSKTFLNKDHDNAEVQAAVNALSQKPGVFGLGVAQNSGVMLNRRRVMAIGEEPVVVALPPSATREALFKELSGNRQTEDLVGLSRASIARLRATFPPAEMAEPYVENGSLLIVGGGGMTEEMWQTFIDSAGGPDAPIVILPTASNPPNPNSGEARVLQRMGATDVTVLPQNTPAGVGSEEFVTALKRAKGVWFGGGRQWNFVDAYDGTGAVELFHDVLRRGGVIAGSSAGASIQAEYMVRGSPLVNTIMMAEGYERGFGFLPGSAVDQHFTQRDRFNDLKSVYDTFPQLMCFGIDETTGIYIRKNVLQVMGRGGVAIFDKKTTPDEGKDYFALTTGEYFDLRTRKKITADEAEAQLAAESEPASSK